MELKSFLNLNIFLFAFLLLGKSSFSQKCDSNGVKCISCTNYQTCTGGIPDSATVSCKRGAVCADDKLKECQMKLNCYALNECIEAGIFPDAMVDSNFFVCLSDGGTGFLKYEFSCKDDSFFDQSTQSCASRSVTSPNPNLSSPEDPIEQTDPTSTSTDPTTADPTTADPTVTDPTTADPTVTDPTTTDPITTVEPTTTVDPTTTDPTTTDPTTTDPITTVEPTTTVDPTTTDPTTTEPTTVDPTATDPSTTDPTTTNPTTTEPTTVDPTATDPSTTDPTTTNPTTTEPTTAGPTTADLTPTTILPPTVCPMAGIFPVLDNCKMYYRCSTSLKPFYYICPGSSYFNENILKCSLTITPACQEQILKNSTSTAAATSTTTPKPTTTSTTTTTTTTPKPTTASTTTTTTPKATTTTTTTTPKPTTTTTTTISTTTSTTTSAPFTCQTSGTFENPSDCKTYYRCSTSGKIFRYVCPGNTYFNEFTKRCSLVITPRCKNLL